ncbi:hypothetical protein [Haloplanus litoreus]|uniref:hypothetical protein n=1 Tax=Haloplanus litoreus TaxID=767515 RepID=UPI0036D3AF10
MECELHPGDRLGRGRIGGVRTRGCGVSGYVRPSSGTVRWSPSPVEVTPRIVAPESRCSRRRRPVRGSEPPVPAPGERRSVGGVGEFRDDDGCGQRRPAVGFETAGIGQVAGTSDHRTALPVTGVERVGECRVETLRIHAIVTPPCSAAHDRTTPFGRREPSACSSRYSHQLLRRSR